MGPLSTDWGSGLNGLGADLTDWERMSKQSKARSTFMALKYDQVTAQHPLNPFNPLSKSVDRPSVPISTGRSGEVDDTRKMTSHFFVDVDKHGTPLGIEILAVKGFLAQKEPVRVTLDLEKRENVLR